ncbi:DUF4474 domain-containing protein [Clostridium sp. SHJSY1]|nr:DUF4474 domain-containing protein [Clostridium sp. SHJSY1]
MIWLWKGDYLNIGAGAEVGIYYGGGPHWLTGVDYAMPMTLALYDNEGNEIFNWKPGEDNWWCTGFNPNYQKAKAENLNVYGSIDFSGRLDIWNSFYEENNGKSMRIFDPINYIAKFKW